MHLYKNTVIKRNVNRIRRQMAYFKLEEGIKDVSHEIQFKRPANLFSGWEKQN
jgi:hypothetical protein